MFCRLGRRKAMSKSNLGMGGVTMRLYLLYNLLIWLEKMVDSRKMSALLTVG
jgi:hypothetical protein